MTDVIRFESLEVEALAEIANEAAEQVESFARKAVEHAERCGRALIAIREKLPHGEWGKWLGRNFDYSQEHARRYMTIAANSTRVLNLKDATSIREALRMIADDAGTPKREQKALENVVAVRDVASEVAAECGVTREQIIRDGEFAAAVDKVAETIPDIRQKVRSGEVSQTDVINLANAKSTNRDDQPESPKRDPSQQENEKKSPTVVQIERTLIKLGKDKKRHSQLIQIASIAMWRLTDDERIQLFVSQFKKLTPEHQRLVMKTVSTEGVL